MLPVILIGVLLAVVIFAYVQLVQAVRKYYLDLRNENIDGGRLPIIILVIMFLILCIYSWFAVYCGKLVYNAFMSYMGG